MKKHKNYLPITRSILIFCIILIFAVLMSCNGENHSKTLLNTNKTDSLEKKLVNKNVYNFEKDFVTSTSEEDIDETIRFKGNNSKDKVNQQEVLDVKNIYYGKYNLNDEDILGSFEVTRNSIVFTPDDGNSREVIHFSDMRNIDKLEHPDGKVDLFLQYNGYEKVIKNVDNEMFANVLLYTAK